MNVETKEKRRAYMKDWKRKRIEGEGKEPYRKYQRASKAKQLHPEMHKEFGIDTADMVQITKRIKNLTPKAKEALFLILKQDIAPSS